MSKIFGFVGLFSDYLVDSRMTIDLRQENFLHEKI